MKNKILSVGIAFAFLLIAACSHKGGEVTSLTLPPDADIAKIPEQQTPAVQTPQSPTSPATGPTISNLPPPTDTTPPSEPQQPAGNIPPPLTVSPDQTTISERTPQPGHGPIIGGIGSGGTSGGGTGTNPPAPAANQSPIITTIVWQYGSENNLSQELPFDFNMEYPLELPPEAQHLLFRVVAEDPEGDPITYTLKNSSNQLAQNNSGRLDTGALTFMTGQNTPLTITVGDAAHPSAVSFDFLVQRASPPPAAGSSSGPTQVEPIFPPPIITGILLQKELTGLTLEGDNFQYFTIPMPGYSQQVSVLGKSGTACDMSCPANHVVTGFRASWDPELIRFSITDWMWVGVIDYLDLKCSPVTADGVNMAQTIISSSGCGSDSETFDEYYRKDFRIDWGNNKSFSMATGFSAHDSNNHDEINSFGLFYRLVNMSTALLNDPPLQIERAGHAGESLFGRLAESQTCDNTTSEVMTGLQAQLSDSGDLIGFSGIYCSHLTPHYSSQ